MVLMDKMKEHSSAIQPVFGYGGFNGFFMLEQVFNTNPLISLIEEEDPIDSPIYLPPDISPFNFLGAMQHPEEDPVVSIGNTFQQSFTSTATDQGFQTTGILDHESHLSVAEMVANAVEQHIIAHHTQGETNNQPSIAQLVANAIQQNTTGTQHQPINISGMIGNTLHFQVLANVSDIGHVPGATLQQEAANSHQSHADIAGLLTNALQSQITAAQPPQQGTGGMNAYQHYMEHIQQETTSQSSSTSSELSTPNYPLGGESNSPSLLPFYAPVSPPIPNLLFGNDFLASDDEGYVPSVASNIVIIDSAESSDSADENQINNLNVPNQSS